MTSIAAAVEAVDQVLDQLAAVSRPHRHLLELLCAAWLPKEVLVRESAVSFADFNAFLAILEPDLERRDDLLRIRRDRVDPYRERAGAGPVIPRAAGDEADRTPAAKDALERVAAKLPLPKKRLDHVSATPATVVGRAQFLSEYFWLPGSDILLVGDHDLTSVALALLLSPARSWVVDIDDDVLDLVSEETGRLGYPATAAFGDLRMALPERCHGVADIAFTDPPYTPEGIRLFVSRAFEGLRSLEHGRVVLAYGYGRHPALGVKVQKALASLDVAYEAVLPAFNRYVGAEAIGSASNLYVLRATAATRRDIAKERSRAIALYTHGPQAVEAPMPPLDPADLANIVEATSMNESAMSVIDFQGTGRRNQRATVAELLQGSRATDNPLVVDLRLDPGSLLLRVLFAARSEHVAALVDNNHPDTTSQAAQGRLRALLSGKYDLRFIRSRPRPTFGIVEAVRVDDTKLPPESAARRRVLDRPMTRTGDLGLTVADVDPESCVMELPRTSVRKLLEAAAGAAARQKMVDNTVRSRHDLKPHKRD